MTYVLSGKARNDLADIWDYVAIHNESAADKLIDSLTQRLRQLGAHPYIGRARNDLRTGYRSITEGEYLIFYRLERPHVRVARIVHGKRYLPKLLPH